MGERHVWVKEKFGPRHFPGLLLDWRCNRYGEWDAFVTWDNQTTADGQIQTGWVPADRLRPVSDGVPRLGTGYDPPRGGPTQGAPDSSRPDPRLR